MLVTAGMEKLLHFIPWKDNPDTSKLLSQYDEERKSLGCPARTIMAVETITSGPQSSIATTTGISNASPTSTKPSNAAGRGGHPRLLGFSLVALVVAAIL